MDVLRGRGGAAGSARRRRDHPRVGGKKCIITAVRMNDVAKWWRSNPNPLMSAATASAHRRRRSSWHGRLLVAELVEVVPPVVEPQESFTVSGKPNFHSPKRKGNERRFADEGDGEHQREGQARGSHTDVFSSGTSAASKSKAWKTNSSRGRRRRSPTPPSWRREPLVRHHRRPAEQGVSYVERPTAGERAVLGAPRRRRHVGVAPSHARRLALLLLVHAQMHAGGGARLCS